MSVTSLPSPRPELTVRLQSTTYTANYILNIARVVAIQFSYDAVYALDWAAGLQSHGGKV